jgi:hypothetical protein
MRFQLLTAVLLLFGVGNALDKTVDDDSRFLTKNSVLVRLTPRHSPPVATKSMQH